MNKQVKFIKLNPIIGICTTLFFASLGSLLSYIQAFGESNDFQIYWKYFVSMEYAPGCLDEVSDFEIGFHSATCFLAPIFQSADLLLAFFVFFSLLLKLSILWLTAATSNSPDTHLMTCYFLALILYFSKYFPIHELTQIRISLSIAFLFVGIFILLNEKPSFIKNISIKSIFSLRLLKSRLRFLIIAVIFFIACLFHLTSILALPLLFMSFYIKTRKHVFISSVGIALFVKLIFLNYSLPIVTEIIPRMGEYLNPNYDAANLFSAVRLLNIILAVVGLIYFDSNNRYQTYFLNLYIFSIVFFYCLTDVPTLAYRFYEMIQVYSILLIAVMRSKEQLIFTVPWVVITACSSIYIYYTGGFFS